ncbi:GPGG-motif small membrane protein [Ilumatobacter nonamiensis]|uniref:GPGG-motif small membrane protein n=1 Tax=Ilumatobacter nonamiensis TaxID=467093 RepID=UPI00034D5556|nr:GPGG-motif small membrane protein [Ilumatobacter nonamiensis]
MAFILWLIAVILVIAGIIQLFQGQIILGIVLIVLGFLIGPGGYSIFSRRN